MADLSKIRLNNTNYNLKDKRVREFLETGWIPAGMEEINFYNDITQTYEPTYSGCAILSWFHNEGTEENPDYKYTYFYSTNSLGRNFHSIDNKILGYNPQAGEWNYYDDELNIHLSSITDWGEGFPEIQYGYKFPNGVYYTSISNINTSSILCAEDSPGFLYNKIMSGIQVIATIELSGYVYSYAPLIHSTETSAYFFIVDADEYKLIEITNTQIPDSNQVPSDLRNKYECNSINFHDPEDDEDVDDMLESLDLTVIDDDNLVGSAEIGSGNVIDWNPAKQVNNDSFIKYITIIESYDSDTGNYTYEADKSFNEINTMFTNELPMIVYLKKLSGDNLICPFSESWDDFDNGGKEAFLFTYCYHHIQPNVRIRFEETQVTIRKYSISTYSYTHTINIE